MDIFHHFLTLYRPNDLSKKKKKIDWFNQSWKLLVAAYNAVWRIYLKPLSFVLLQEKTGRLYLCSNLMQRFREVDTFPVKCQSLTHTNTHLEAAQYNLATEQQAILTAVMDRWVPLVYFIHSDFCRHPEDSNWWLQSFRSWPFLNLLESKFRECE